MHNYKQTNPGMLNYCTNMSNEKPYCEPRDTAEAQAEWLFSCVVMFLVVVHVVLST